MVNDDTEFEATLKVGFIVEIDEELAGARCSPWKSIGAEAPIILIG